MDGWMDACSAVVVRCPWCLVWCRARSPVCMWGGALPIRSDDSGDTETGKFSLPGFSMAVHFCLLILGFFFLETIFLYALVWGFVLFLFCFVFFFLVT